MNEMTSMLERGIKLPEVKCSNCIYWVRVGMPNESGQCCRYAPRPATIIEGDDSDYFAVWAITHEGHFCGEFVKDEVGKAK